MNVLKPSKVRTEADRTALAQAVTEIINNVRENGDAALIDYNTRFDQCDRQALRVSREEIDAAYAFACTAWRQGTADTFAPEIRFRSSLSGRIDSSSLFSGSPTGKSVNSTSAFL